MGKIRSFVALFLALLFASCAGGLRPPSGLAGAPAAPAAVERFLQLAAQQDYTGMGWVFGTADGPVLSLYPRPEVEQRMFALAAILDHDGFIVGNGSPVPGRLDDALRFDVIMTTGARNQRVPFTAVRGPQGRWFVEQVDLEAITAQ